MNPRTWLVLPGVARAGHGVARAEQTCLLSDRQENNLLLTISKQWIVVQLDQVSTVLALFDRCDVHKSY